MLNKLRRIEKQSLDPLALWPISIKDTPLPTETETKVKLTFTYSFIKQMSSESIQQKGERRGWQQQKGGGGETLSRLKYARMRFLIYDKGTRKK